MQMGKCWKKPQLRIRHLNGNASGAERNIFLFPRFVERAFGIRVGGFSAAELNRKGGAEIARLQAIPLDPNIFDAGHFRSHVLDSGNRGFFIHSRHAGPPLDFNHVKNCLRLSESALTRNVAAAQRDRGASPLRKNFCGVRECEYAWFLLGESKSAVKQV